LGITVGRAHIFGLDWLPSILHDDTAEELLDMGFDFAWVIDVDSLTTPVPYFLHIGSMAWQSKARV
jgi:hypothetical protein